MITSSIISCPQAVLLICADHFRWWYGPLLPDDDSFPKACRQTFTGFILSFSFHLARKRPADVFLDFLTNSSSVVIVFLNELANALTAASYSELESTDALHQYIEQNPSNNLANVLDVKEQRRKLKAISEDILQSFLEPKAYSCEPVRIFLRQILAGVCLEMTVQTCSKPEWINGWIVYLLEESEPELMNAIDVGIEGATATNSATADSAVSEDTVGIAKNVNDPPASSEQGHHRRTVNRAEEAMDEAMLEAKRLSEMIATEEARKARENNDTVSSGTTTGGDPTSTSSHSDLGALPNSSLSLSGDSAQDAPAQQSTVPESDPSFTNFDQLLNKQPPTALQQGHSRTQLVIHPLTLQNASISIFDDAVSGEKSIIRSKPTVDYLLQVEPATSQHPGWMIARKYADFETLHEVLKRISVISGVPEFADRHSAIPGWKNRSKEALRLSLERYLRDALSFNRLAESEGMKRFLEKDQGLGRSSPNIKQGGFGFPTPAAFESMGKGMLDVLSAAPKGAAGGGKAILGGVSGVLGGVGSLGQKKQASIGNNKSAQSSSTALARADTNRSWTLSTQDDRASQEVPRGSLSGYEGERTPNSGIRPDDENSRLASLDLSSNASTRPTTSNDQSGKAASFVESSSRDCIDANSLHLPPPPSEIPDNWCTSPAAPLPSTSTPDPRQQQSPQTSTPALPPRPNNKPPKPPLTEKETHVTVELFFATITSLYALSSSLWSIRRTLLTAAKNYLLRPGNPNLEAIRLLIQDTVIDSNISDAGIANHIKKVRENALPTEEELKRWPKEMGEEEKKRLREKARRLLVEKGMPGALTGMMGQAASGEALGRLFDALQVEGVARGVVGALVLQGVRTLVQ